MKRNQKIAGVAAASLIAAAVAAGTLTGGDEALPAFSGGRVPANNYATGKITSGCGAVALDPYTVLTAAHCVLPYDNLDGTDGCDPDPGGDCTPGCDYDGCGRWPAGENWTFVLEETGVEYKVHHFEGYPMPWLLPQSDWTVLKVPEATPITGITFPALWDGTTTADTFISQGYSEGTITECESALHFDTGQAIEFNCVDPPGADASPGDSGGPTYAIISGVPYVAVVHSSTAPPNGGDFDGPAADNVTSAAWINAQMGLDAPVIYDHGDDVGLVEARAYIAADDLGGGVGPNRMSCDLRFVFSGELPNFVIPTEAFCIFGNLDNVTTFARPFENATGTSNEYSCRAELTGTAPYKRGSCTVETPRLAPTVFFLLGYRVKGTEFGAPTWDTGKLRFDDLFANYWQRGWMTSGDTGSSHAFNADVTPPTISAQVLSDTTPAIGQTITCTVTVTDELPDPAPPGNNLASGIDVAGCVLETTARGGDAISCTATTPAGDDYACPLTVPSAAVDTEVWTWKHAYARDRAGNIERVNSGSAAFTVTQP